MAFQVGDDNPLVGLEGRAALLRRLGAVLAAQPAVFGAAGRPGGLFDALTAGGAGTVAAHAILVLLLDTLSAIWPAQNAIGDQALGDCWRHPAVQGEGLTAGWVPFHKLSQWLTYSLLEPFEWAGVPVTGLDALTGLPEYRNGGLLIDTGVLRPLPPDWDTRPWQAGDELHRRVARAHRGAARRAGAAGARRTGPERRTDAAGLRARRRLLGGGPSAGPAAA